MSSVLESNSGWGLREEAPGWRLRSVTSYLFPIRSAVTFYVGVYPRTLVTVPACALESEVPLSLKQFAVLLVSLAPLPPHDEEGGDS